MTNTEPKHPTPLRKRLPQARVKRIFAAPFLTIEWGLEWVSHALANMAIFGVLSRVAQLSILVAVVSYFTNAGQRRQAAEDARKAKHYQAWQMIIAADGKRNSFGRVDALEDLNSDGVSLVNIDLGGARLDSVQLPGADLWFASLGFVRLADANLTNAMLADADLSHAYVEGADLTLAILAAADLTGATLARANLARAMLWEADLTDANLSHANLLGAELRSALLSNADLATANLMNADLTDAVLTGAESSDATILNLSNLWGVTPPSDDFLRWAIREKGAVCVKDRDEFGAIRDGELEWDVDPDTVEDLNELCNVQLRRG